MTVKLTSIKGEAQDAPSGAVVKQLDGRLWLTKISDGEQVSSAPLTDCTVETLSAIVAEDGRRSWTVKLKRNGEAANTATVDAPTMESPAELNAWAASVGGYDWNLTKNDKHHVKSWILGHAGAKNVVIAGKRTGTLDQYGVIIGHDLCMDATGALAERREDGTVELFCNDDQFRVFTIVNPHNHDFPFLKPGCDSMVAAQLHLRSFCREWKLNMGSYAGTIALGWYTASILAHDELMKRGGEFPHLLTWGKKNGGKTTMIRDVHEIVGMREWAEPQAPVLTYAGMRNRLGTTGGWPLYVDEVRDEANQKHIADMMRVSYNGSCGSHTDKAGKIYSYTKHRGLSLLGEQLIGGDAERTRCVQLLITKKTYNLQRRSGVIAMLPNAREAWMGLLTSRQDIRTFIYDMADRYRQKFMARGVDSRQAWCWGVAAAGVSIAIGDAGEDRDDMFDDIIKEMETRSGAATQELEDEDRGIYMWDAIKELVDEKKLRNEQDDTWIRKIQPRECTGKTYGYAVNVALLYRKAHSEIKYRSLIGKKSAIYAALKDDKYLIAWDRITDRSSLGEHGVMRTAVFFSETTSIPEWAKRLADGPARDWSE